MANEGLISKIDKITIAMVESNKYFTHLSFFVEKLSRDLNLLSKTISNPLITSGKVVIDMWDCIIEAELFENKRVESVARKTKELLNEKTSSETLSFLLHELGALDASLSERDSNSASRPIKGLMPRNIDQSFYELIMKHNFDNHNIPSSWKEWISMIESITMVLEEIAKTVPKPNSMGSFPVSLHLVFLRLLDDCKEQVALQTALDILKLPIPEMETEDHSSIFRLECLEILSRIIPLPQLLEGEEE